jgi:hypothetical protein
MLPLGFFRNPFKLILLKNEAFEAVLLVNGDVKGAAAAFLEPRLFIAEQFDWLIADCAVAAVFCSADSCGARQILSQIFSLSVMSLPIMTLRSLSSSKVSIERRYFQPDMKFSL